MTVAVMPKSSERLEQTAEGQALLALIKEYGAPVKMATALDIDPRLVRQWIYCGKVSMRGALHIEQKTGRMKEEFRPDLSASDWERQPSGPVPGEKARIETDDSRLLVSLAEKFGTVNALCSAAFCSPSDYHTWKSRGRIPAIKLPTFLALQQQAEQ